MLSPKRVKHRKVQKGRLTGLATRGTEISFGDFGLQATSCGHITARQLEAARIAMTRHIKRGGKVFIRVFPDKPQTKKPLEVRMGSGKGAVEQWVVPVKPGRMLYEIDGVDEETAKEAFRLAGHKLSVQVRFVKRGTEVL
jgi:large subunit ribosomal protein L16